ncbi:hypothetical protein KM043_015379 [Ampulex compressa]|nr:hypothetical protein KM043_015379 [Ampulex compressa]
MAQGLCNGTARLCASFYAEKVNVCTRGDALKPDSHDRRRRYNDTGHIVLSRGVIYLELSPTSTPIVAHERAPAKRKGRKKEREGGRSWDVEEGAKGLLLDPFLRPQRGLNRGNLQVPIVKQIYVLDAWTETVFCSWKMP